ncbi:hypothetical protein D6C91_02389 [Aureobasidium pullulans]|uniref:BTB domain-containing protein n=1 Tax=Aureobasidium pullulans TaxID=5580 RepID=A0A4S9TRA4_AURPU|nr:hypothetical protein D6C91_02389 [Aureobasidium pullulans]
MSLFKPGTTSSVNSSVRLSHALFNDQTLSDVRIEFNGQHIFGHKAILARQSEYFFRAFTGQFPVASSGTISLGDDDDPKAIHAMVRHLYDLPYDQASVLFAKSTSADLMFHINVFEVADKYDVPSLRVLSVGKFAWLMESIWSIKKEEVCQAIQRLCAPNAVSFADRSLQASAATFCSAHILDLIKIDSFVKMLEEGEPFAGRLLTAVLKGKSESVIQTKKCDTCATVADSTIQANLTQKCISCISGSASPNAPLNPHRSVTGFGGGFSAGFGNAPTLQHYKNFLPL